MTAEGGARTPIPGLCRAQKPDDHLYCTEREGHGKSGLPGDGPTDHYHWPTQTSWPRYKGEQQ